MNYGLSVFPSRVRLPPPAMFVNLVFDARHHNLPKSFSSSLHIQSSLRALFCIRSYVWNSESVLGSNHLFLVRMTTSLGSIFHCILFPKFVVFLKDSFIYMFHMVPCFPSKSIFGTHIPSLIFSLPKSLILPTNI